MTPTTDDQPRSNGIPPAVLVVGGIFLLFLALSVVVTFSFMTSIGASIAEKREIVHQPVCSAGDPNCQPARP